MGDSQHIPLAKCRVLYLGSAVPLDTKNGLEAVQKPLRERYPLTTSGEVPGIDAWVTAFSSGLMLSYTNEPKASVWFPISGLVLCASVKCLPMKESGSGRQVATFIPLDSQQAKDCHHPPIFSCIIRRPMGVKVLECHSFICKTEKAAMALVHACTHAYEHKEGWVDGEPSINLYSSRSKVIGIETHLPHLVPASTNNCGCANMDFNVPTEFCDKPPLSGYYYGNKGLIKNYNVYDESSNEDYLGPQAIGANVQKAKPDCQEPIRLDLQVHINEDLNITKVTTKEVDKKVETTKKTVAPAEEPAPVKKRVVKKTVQQVPKATVRPQPTTTVIGATFQPGLAPGMIMPGGLYPGGGGGMYGNRGGMYGNPGMMMLPPAGGSLGLMPPPPPLGMELEHQAAAPDVPIMFAPLGDGGVGGGYGGGLYGGAGGPMGNYFADWDPYAAMPPIVFLPLEEERPRVVEKYCCRHRDDVIDDDCPNCHRHYETRPRSPEVIRPRRSHREPMAITYDDDPRRYRDMRPEFFADNADDFIMYGPRGGGRMNMMSMPDPRQIVVERRVEVPYREEVIYADRRRADDRMDVDDYPRRGDRYEDRSPTRGGRRADYDEYLPPRRADFDEDVYKGRDEIYRGRGDYARRIDDDYRRRDVLY